MATIRLSGVYFPGVELLSGIGTAIILYFGATMVLDQEVTVGVMVAFVGYLSSFFDPIQQLSQLYATFQSAMAALEKIFGVLDTEPAPGRRAGRRRAAAHPRRDRAARGGLRVRPRARCSRTSTCTSRRARPSRWSGTTGAGKSTLAKLIARFYDPVEGAVLIDGHDLRAVTQRSLRDQLAVVPQEGHLFAGTIAENLAFGRPEATDEELYAAAVAVGADGFIAGAARRHGHGHQREGLRAVGGPAPAHRLRPRPRRRPAAADPRRGHLVGGPARRGAHRGGARDPPGRSHRHRDRPPPQHDPRRRPHRGARRPGASWSRAPTTSSWPRAGATPSSTATGSRSRAERSVPPGLSPADPGD